VVVTVIALIAVCAVQQASAAVDCGAFAGQIGDGAPPKIAAATAFCNGLAAAADKPVCQFAVDVFPRHYARANAAAKPAIAGEVCAHAGLVFNSAADVSISAADLAAAETTAEEYCALLLEDEILAADRVGPGATRSDSTNTYLNTRCQGLKREAPDQAGGDQKRARIAFAEVDAMVSSGGKRMLHPLATRRVASIESVAGQRSAQAMRFRRVFRKSSRAFERAMAAARVKYQGGLRRCAIQMLSSCTHPFAVWFSIR